MSNNWPQWQKSEEIMKRLSGSARYRASNWPYDCSRSRVREPTRIGTMVNCPRRLCTYVIIQTSAGDRFIRWLNNTSLKQQFGKCLAVNVNCQRSLTNTVLQRWQPTTSVCQLWAMTATFEWCPRSMKWLSTSRGRDGNLDSPSSGTIWWNSSSLGHLPLPHIGSAWLSLLCQQQQQQQQQQQA